MITFKPNQKVRFTTPLGKSLTGTVIDSYVLSEKTHYNIVVEESDGTKSQYGIEPEFIFPITGNSRREKSLQKYREKLAKLEADCPRSTPKELRHYNSERAKIIEMIALREKQLAEVSVNPVQSEPAKIQQMVAKGTQNVEVEEFNDEEFDL